jgi:hypothetical protein
LSTVGYVIRPHLPAPMLVSGSPAILPGVMRRHIPALLLVLALLAACAPAEGFEPTPPPTPTAAALAVLPSPIATPAPTAPPTPSPTASPTPAPIPEPTASGEPKPYAINLASAADFVPQYTFEWCVGASIMMARSIITDSRNESKSSQRRLWERARDLTIGSPYGGANPAGWTAALNDLDLGRYRLVSVPTFDGAVDRAALALAETKRPVGLVMWAGRHAWVMTGFKATADPRKHDDARVTRVRVMDPLYPHGSRWGASPAPNRLITLKTLAKQFVKRDRPEYDFGVDPGWLLVLPVD